MKKIVFYLLTILLLINFISCKENKQENKETFIKLRDLDLQRQENQDVFIRKQFSETNDGKLLILVPLFSNDMNLYNYETGELIEVLKFPEIDLIDGVYFKNKDSIYFVTSRGEKGIFLTDSRRSYIDTLTYFRQRDIRDMNVFLNWKQEFKMGNSTDFAFSNIAPLIVEDNNFYIPNQSNYLGDMANQRLLFIFNIKDGVTTVNKHIVGIPGEFFTETTSSFPFDSGLAYTRNNDGKTVVSYNPDHNIYVFNDTAVEKKVLAKSKYIDRLPGQVTTKGLSLETVNRRRVEEAYYLGIIYDKYRDLYYRVAKLSIPYKDKNGLINEGNSKFSVMVLDSDFNILSEQVFNNQDYHMDIIVTDEGILLSKIDDLSGVSRFTVFKLNDDIFK